MSDVLVADIGGTHARFAIADSTRLGFRAAKIVATKSFPAAADAARHYLDAAGATPKRAIIAGAGPVINARIQLTNCPWIIESGAIAQALGLQDCRLINDFEALAHALPLLEPGDAAFIGNAAARLGPKLIVGPGTGFGSALIVEAGGKAAIVPGEGGHIALGIADIPGADIVSAGDHEAGRLTVEAIISGRGIGKLYRARCRASSTEALLADAADIVNAAIGGTDQSAIAAINLFCAILGSAAGDLALATGAKGGVFVAGGIAPKILRLLKKSAFRERFEAKAPMQDYMRQIGTAVITHPQPALLGLASLALDP